ncbi:Slp family lipoprotein [Thioalkalivibrio sp. ALJ24]|uniref:Slp family lipoprotein n=1 Tax=Thioalkalivibrio sp. ALJ24 TaxID=545276 RepID=UPI000A022BF5|nr:Slp family lipoprotein [Thioalkalivibrio sp. ALJ24]
MSERPDLPVASRVLRRLAPAAALLLLLSGCAATPLEPPRPAEPVEPRAVTADRLPQTEQLWGGVIAEVSHQPEVTVLEIVAYPLRGQEPRTGAASEGRFRLRVGKFLDPVDYRPGRRITATGAVTSIEDGTVGEAEYRFPVMEARQLHLWPVMTRSAPGRVNFGIGIGIGL